MSLGIFCSVHSIHILGNYYKIRCIVMGKTINVRDVIYIPIYYETY